MGVFWPFSGAEGIAIWGIIRTFAARNGHIVPF